MTQRERFLTALGGGIPERPPAAPIYLSLYLEPQRRRHLAEVYAEMSEGATSLRLSHEEEIDARVEALVRTASTLEESPAWFPAALGPAANSLSGCKVTFRPGQCLWHSPGATEPTDLLAEYDDTCEATWEISEELPSPEEITEQSVEVPPDQWIATGCTEYTQRTVGQLGDRFVLAGAMGTPFWHCYHRLGFAGLMRAMRERPETVEALARQHLPQLVAYGHAYAHAGLPCVFIEECLSSSDLISEQDYLRFSYPFMRELAVALKELGLRTVYYYCGGIENRLQHLAELPVDALAFEESKKDFVIDLARVRREVGPDRLLFGNTDAVLLRDGTEGQIAADVAQQYEAAGPRLVASMGSPATLDTPPEKIDTLIRATEGIY